MQNWVVEELRTSSLGDAKLDRRYEKVLDSLSQKPSASIPAACRTWNETLGAYRFFQNERIDENGILKPHKDATLKRIQEQKVILAVQDTTEIEVTRPNKNMENAGPLNDASRLGFYNHAMLALNTEGIPLGIIGADMHARDMADFLKGKEDKNDKEKSRKQKPIEEKESYRWIVGYRRACEIQTLSPETKVVCVGDSECDIYELFVDNEYSKENKADWLIRACQDRSLRGEKIQNNTYPKLWDDVSETKVIGEFSIKVRKNKKQSKGNGKRNKTKKTARETSVEVRSKQVVLKAPYRKGEKLEDVTVNAVLVREKKPPKDEPPVEWMLLTSLAIDTYKDVSDIIGYYCIRWQIEIYFRVLKSGCRVEHRQFEYAERYKPCLAIYMIIAWRVMFTLMLGRECPDMKCDEVFSEAEWKSVYLVVKGQKPPANTPTLGQIIKMIAQLGGYIGRKHDGPPGPKAMWIGMQRMRDFAITYQAVLQIEGSK